MVGDVSLCEAQKKKSIIMHTEPEKGGSMFLITVNVSLHRTNQR